MKRPLFALWLLLALASAGAARAGQDSLEFGRFGRVALVRSTPRPSRVVLFVSGDGGWKTGVVDMAGHLAAKDALVVGIDIRHYMKSIAAARESCAYSAADFEGLSQYVQKTLGYPRYVTPILAGYSSGATLVYALLAQAPPGTFAGALSLGFCPDLPGKPLCKGRELEHDLGGRRHATPLYRPAKELGAPWFVFQGDADQVCDPPSTRRFVTQVPEGELVWLPKVGHGFSVEKNWLPQFETAFAKLAAASAPPPAPPPLAGAPDVSDLPLVEVPSEGGARDALAVVLSGDGGWTNIDRDLGNALAESGVPAVGWNSLQYYWRKRSPEEASADLARVLRRYLTSWHKQRALVVGYSFGADVAPFLVSRLPADLRQRVTLVGLLGLSPTAGFEFHVGEWLGATAEDERPVAPELEKLRGLPLLCLYGEDEKDSPCPKLDPALVKAVQMGGGHHFGGDYAAVARQLLAALGPS
jgi:type IV secretory pathway VirJ component